MKNPVIVSNVVNSESSRYYNDDSGAEQPITMSRTGAETNIMDMDKANRIIGMNADSVQMMRMLDQSAIAPLNDVFTIGNPTGGRPDFAGPFNGYTNIAAAHDRWAVPPEITAQTGNVVYTSADGSTSNSTDMSSSDAMDLGGNMGEGGGLNPDMGGDGDMGMDAGAGGDSSGGGGEDGLMY